MNQTTNQIPAYTTANGIQIPGDTILVVTDCRVTGGKRTSTTRAKYDEEGNKVTTLDEVTRVIDDVKERARAESLASAGAHIVRKNSSHTLIGKLTTSDRLVEIKREMDEHKARVEAFNATSVHSKVRVGFMAIPIGTQIDEGCARTIADSVRENMLALRDALLSGSESKIRAAMLNAKNVHLLAVGLQRESVIAALQQAKDGLADLKAQIKRGVTPESAGASLDVSMLDGAAALFTY